jgi:NAD(P)-dependent dehydrogenase (short-subunit alcohol dehydrogenase family)
MGRRVTTRRLEGVVCAVTGAARGIGLAIAERLAAEGGRVACLDVSARRLDPSVAELAAKGLDVRGYACDVGDRAAVAASFAAIERDFGAPLGVLVNNAVWARFQPLAEIDDETLERTLNIGLKALVWTMQAALPQMQRRGKGSIVNLSSTSALQAFPGSIAYGAMKAGVLGLTRSAAIELSPQRIRVNTIVPGMVGTEASKAQFDETTLAARQALMPLGRFGEPEEIARAVAFLASDDAAYVQGTELVVDGGWTVAAT